MQLSKEETRMLKGEYGFPKQKSMEMLTAIGEAYGAKRLIPINMVHIPTGAALVAGEAWMEYVEEIADKGGKIVVQATTNPASIDPEIWEDIGIPSDIAQKQIRHTNNLARLGALTCHTCTPYLIGFVPKIGEHISSGESSNILYMNSYLGVKCNRNGAPAALAAALTGRVPEWGLHLKENRKGKVLVKLKTRLEDEADYGALGFYIGKKYTTTIPVIQGIPSTVTGEDLKHLAAGLNTSGAISLCHIIGITPEAGSMEDAFQNEEPEEVIEVGNKEIKETFQDLESSNSDSKVNWIMIGCPHASIWELKQIQHLLSDRKVKSDIEFWICTSKPVKAYAERTGILQSLLNAGIRIVCETCPACAPADKITQHLFGSNNIKMATNSAKHAHYMKAEWDISIFYGSIESCVAAAFSGEWKGQ